MKKLLVIVPYRDRESHLEKFIPYITTTLKNQNIHYNIIIVEQSPEKLFNRGLLCNIGFYIYANQYDYICFHDVDIIGENFDYSYEPIVTHLSAMDRSRNYKEFYQRCLGGVTIFPKNDFIKINGFSNQYWGWGAEDDDLRLRCDVMNVAVQRKPGRFYSLPHKKILRKDKPQKSPGFIENINRWNNFQKMPIEKKLEAIRNDGLSDINKYFVLSDTIQNKDYTLLKTTIK